MSDENGQDRKDKQSDESVAKHLAEKRRALDLRTRPMEVIDDLDWDIPDFDDDDEDLSPGGGPAEDEDLAPPAEDLSPKAEDDAPSEREKQKRASSGTMMMSASAFKDAMDDESPGDEAAEEPSTDEEEPAASADKEDSGDDAAEAEAADESGSEDEATPRSTSGTMMMSTDGFAAVDEEQVDDDSDDTEEDTDVEAADDSGDDDEEDTEAEPAADARSAGGTMLISGDALNEELAKEAEEQETAEKTPYEELAEEAEERHHQGGETQPDSEEGEEAAAAAASSASSAKEAIAKPAPTQADNRVENVPRWKGQGMLIGAVIALGVGILVLLYFLLFNG